MTSQVLYSYIYTNKLNHFISSDSSRKLLAVLPPPPYYNVANPVIFWIQARSVQRCLWGEGRGGACVKPHKRKFVPVIVHLVIYRWAPAPERPICANPGLNFVPFLYLPSNRLLRVTYFVLAFLCLGATTVFYSIGTTVFFKLELHVLRQENLVQNLA